MIDLHQEEKPQQNTSIYIFSLAMILAPFGNICLSLYLNGIDQWYSPAMWVSTWSHISQIDQIWLFLLPVSGVLLQIKRKSYWLLAFSLLIVIFALNVFRFLSEESSIPMGIWGLWLFISCLSPLILLKLKYPYIERRENIAGLHPRHSIQVSASLQLSNNTKATQGCLVNISKTGALFEISPADVGTQMDFEINVLCSVQITNLSSRFKAKIIRCDSNAVAIHWIPTLKSTVLSKILKNNDIS